ncbi:hypothetical protein CI102_4021 [Trichoderma harzianum]|nr:hypothetical protein CI102_4021 [Trichoderma harzianum]
MAFATLGTETSKTKGLRLSGHAQSQAGFDQAASSSYVTAAGLRASGTGERPPSACGTVPSAEPVPVPLISCIDDLVLRTSLTHHHARYHCGKVVERRNRQVGGPAGRSLPALLAALSHVRQNPGRVPATFGERGCTVSTRQSPHWMDRYARGWSHSA